ncbi:MAG: hypothetical protein HOZ81_54710 [Streptomyces sp.]|nr:hypothetical protein [Streptomyces sp.]
MSQTDLPRQSAPVERTITGATTADAAGVDQSWSKILGELPFADDGDE